jgi:hypothetical protein
MKKSFSESDIAAKMMYKFLKQHHCLKEYTDNTIRQGLYRPAIQEYLENKDIIKLIKSNHASIDFSFVWSTTPQGHRYWHILDAKFVDLYFKKL